MKASSNRAPQPSLADLDARYRAPLMVYFQRRLIPRADAEDMTQEVFLRLSQRSAAEGSEIVDGFIFTIAANLIRDRSRRSRSRSVNQHVDLDVVEKFVNDESLVGHLDPERILLSREVLARVLNALNAVGSRTRDIFLLYRLEGMRQREIAQLFGISVSAVEKHIVKALAHLGEEFLK